MIRFNGYVVYKDSTVKSTSGALTPTTMANGYKRLNLTINNISKPFLLHRLIVEAHLGEIPNGMVVHHIDHDITNCNLNNLLIVTQEENLIYSGFFKRNGKTKPIEVKTSSGIKLFSSITKASQSLNISSSVLSRRINKKDTRKFNGIMIRYIHDKIPWNSKPITVLKLPRYKYIVVDLVGKSIAIYNTFLDIKEMLNVSSYYFNNNLESTIENPTPTMYIFRKMRFSKDIVDFINENFKLTYNDLILDKLRSDSTIEEIKAIIEIENVLINY